MSTRGRTNLDGIRKGMNQFSRLRTIVETPFYANNVKKINTLKEAYELAKNSPGAIITSREIFEPEKIGLEKGSRVIIFNDGATTGRTASARYISNNNDNEDDALNKVVMDAVYDTRFKKMLYAESVVGLDKDFCVKAHLLIPEGEENILYNWLLNFQPINSEIKEMYKNSKKYDEADIIVFSDPQWKNDAYPNGIAYFDSQNNTLALLGLKYFGEHKKGTLTLAWSIANRNGFASCHGGIKTFHRKDKNPFTLSVFGLSGSGKSTITHHKHEDKYDIKILHDDAFIINSKDKYSIALEPSYFDKTQNYPPNSPDNKFLLSMQNVGATMDEDGNIVAVTEDIRNGNGRAIKSKLWSKNRVNRLDDKIDAICWIMKDPVFPPLVKIENPIMAALLGASLITKRSSAENLKKGYDFTKLVVEPYANPFRTYPLADDFNKFLELFKDGVDCYIINSGDYFGKDIPKEITFSLLEKVIDDNAEFKDLFKIKDFSYLEVEGYELPVYDLYREKLEKSFRTRLDFFDNLSEFDELPEYALDEFRDYFNRI